MFYLSLFAPNASFTLLVNITHYISLQATSLMEGFPSGSLPLYC